MTVDVIAPTPEVVNRSTVRGKRCWSQEARHPADPDLRQPVLRTVHSEIGDSPRPEVPATRDRLSVRRPTGYSDCVTPFAKLVMHACFSDTSRVTAYIEEQSACTVR